MLSERSRYGRLVIEQPTLRQNRGAVQPGWLGWIAAEQVFVVWSGGAWDPVGLLQARSDVIFSPPKDADPTKKALFALSGITCGTTRSFRNLCGGRPLIKMAKVRCRATQTVARRQWQSERRWMSNDPNRPSMA